MKSMHVADNLVGGKVKKKRGGKSRKEKGGEKWGKMMYVRKLTCIYIKRHGRTAMERYSKKRDF